MEMQYFKSAWGDIKNSPGWFGKICLLALLNFIPVFGQIVTLGYLYGWAREIAWGTHEPMPERIFANEDGKFWRRGWFALVLSFVFMLIPYAVMWLGNYWQGFGYSYSFFTGQTVNNPLLVGFGGLLAFVGWIGCVVMAVLAWIGVMRVSIYDRLSSGFQFGKIWKMLRHDTKGILKIFGMDLLFGLIFGIILSIVFIILLVIVITAGVAGLMGAGYSVSPEMMQYMTQAQAMHMLMQFLASAGLVGFIALLIGAFLCGLALVFVQMLIARAMGYWTMQFDVPRWGGQDDPMPFELYEEKQARQQAAAAPQPQTQPQQQAGVSPTVVAPAPASSEPAASAKPNEYDSPAVTYEKPITVGASFFMTPEEIDSLEEDAQAQANETLASEAQRAHGIEDGQAGDPDVGENG